MRRIATHERKEATGHAALPPPGRTSFRELLSRHNSVGGWVLAALLCRSVVQKHMRRIIIFVGLICVVLLAAAAGPAAAADGKAPSWRFNSHGTELPFPRSERAEAVWASGACWTECGSYCAWGMAGCLKEDLQGRCLKLTDKCDRYCQRECRTRGGPYLPIEFPWE